ncbi:hypothetical protein CDEN61S_03902 [Castellaniella denitrificans]
MRLLDRKGRQRRRGIHARPAKRWRSRGKNSGFSPAVVKCFKKRRPRPRNTRPGKGAGFTSARRTAPRPSRTAAVRPPPGPRPPVCAEAFRASGTEAGGREGAGRAGGACHAQAPPAIPPRSPCPAGRRRRGGARGAAQQPRHGAPVRQPDQQLRQRGVGAIAGEIGQDLAQPAFGAQHPGRIPHRVHQGRQHVQEISRSVADTSSAPASSSKRISVSLKKRRQVMIRPPSCSSQKVSSAAANPPGRPGPWRRRRPIPARTGRCRTGRPRFRCLRARRRS